MFGAFASYVVAISAMLFSGLSALTLIYTVKHFDPLETPSSPKHIQPGRSEGPAQHAHPREISVMS